MNNIKIPITGTTVSKLKVGDMVTLSGKIFTGRDAVLPKLVSLFEKGRLKEMGINLEGSVIFHTAVSPAGVGPTSSNKYDIESSIPTLSKAGVKFHLGKGALKPETIASLKEFDSVYAVIPPVTALLGDKTLSSKVIAYEELGMEAMHELEVIKFPAIIAAAHGKSIYDEL